MHQTQTLVQLLAVWSALSAQQRQQLVAQLAQWAARCWQAQHGRSPQPSLAPGGRHEQPRRQGTA